MNSFIPDNEEQAKAFLQAQEEKRRKEQRAKDIEGLKIEASELLKESNFKKDVAGTNYNLLVEAFNAIRATEKRGLIILGAVGTGKTMAIKSLMPNIPVCNLTDTCKLSLLEPHDDEWDIQEGNVFLDDLGNESIKSSYGVKIDVVGNFIMKWHTSVYGDKDNKQRLFATSNLDIGKLQERYGERILDRLFEMCDIIKFTGQSKRRQPVIFR